MVASSHGGRGLAEAHQVEPERAQASAPERPAPAAERSAAAAKRPPTASEHAERSEAARQAGGESRESSETTAAAITNVRADACGQIGAQSFSAQGVRAVCCKAGRRQAGTQGQDRSGDEARFGANRGAGTAPRRDTFRRAGTRTYTGCGAAAGAPARGRRHPGDD